MFKYLCNLFCRFFCKYFFILLIITANHVQAATKQQPTETLQTKEQQLSYTFGTSIAGSLDKNLMGFNIDLDAFTAGIIDKSKNNNLKISNEKLEENLRSIRNLQHDMHKENIKNIALQNLEKSDAFHTKNKKDKNITTLKSGLQYSIITKGNGKSPTQQDAVTVHYRGTLVNGNEFDSSYTRKKPMTFPLNNLIPGWQEALKLMQPGAKWKLYVPPKLAYGESPQSGIPPNSSLIFDIELLAVNPE